MSFSLKSNLIEKLYNSEWQERLINIIFKSLSWNKVNKDDIISLLDSYYMKDKPKDNPKDKTKDKKDIAKDKVIIEELANLVLVTTTPYSEQNNINRAYGKWKNIKPNINFKINGMLDYGGGVGDTAFAIGHNILHLPKNKILVVDVDEFGGVEYIPRNDITFFHFNDISDITTKVDLITVNHVLHHIKAKDYPKIVKLFDRILTKNGLIVLYEHDCDNKKMSTIINLEHMIFDVCGTKKMTYDHFVKGFYAKYLSIDKWKKIFSAHFTAVNIIKLNNVDNSAYIFFKRIKT